MKMPLRSEHHSSASYLASLNGWMAMNESAYQHLVGMFDGNKAWDKKPSFAKQLKSGLSIKHVWLSQEPTEVQKEAALRNLSGFLSHEGMTPVELYHGISPGRGWSVYAVATKD